MLNIDNYSLQDWLAKRSFEWCTHHKPPPRVPLASFGFQKPLANSGGNPRRVALRRSSFWRKNEFRNLAVSPEQNPNFFPKQSDCWLIARAARVVAINLPVRSDCVVKWTNAPRTRVCKNQKISLHFSRVSSPHPSAAKRKKKWKGNFWFCFAVSVSEKSNLILTFLFALFSTLTATEAPSSPRLVVALTCVTSTEEVPTHQSGTSPYKIL